MIKGQKKKTRVKALPHVMISSTMDFNVAKIASARASSTISLTLSLRVSGPLIMYVQSKEQPMDKIRCEHVRGTVK